MGTHLYYRVSLWGKRNVPEFWGTHLYYRESLWGKRNVPELGGHTFSIYHDGHKWNVSIPFVLYYGIAGGSIISLIYRGNFI